jgi:hypothetical protein
MRDQVAAISEAFNRAIEFDNKIAEDRLSDSTWILAVATAGFARLARLEPLRQLGLPEIPAR